MRRGPLLSAIVMANAARNRLTVAFIASKIHRWCSFSSARGAAATFSLLAEDDGPKRIVFLGTPQVAALVLQELLQAAAVRGSSFEVAAVVSRPSSRHWLDRERHAADVAEEAASTRATSLVPGGPQPPVLPSNQQPLRCQPPQQGLGGHRPESAPADICGNPHGPHGPQTQQLPPTAAHPPNWSRHSASAVERLARSSGLSSDRIFCPVSAREPAFLEAMRRLRPALVVTAAYGAMLPQSFLDIPKYGTINIHPSLLPRYRGAAPVQRALQDGCSASGVSLVFTVMKCDAGPVLEQQQVPIPPDIQAPELTEQLFRLGASMLVRQLPRVLSGALTAGEAAQQKEEDATFAPKIVKQEAYLDFRLPAHAVHNHVRAMAGWPGTRASLLVEDKATGTRDPIELKVIRTRVVAPPTVPPPTQASPSAASGPLPPGTSAHVLCTPAGELLVPCGDGNMLSVLEVGRRAGSGNASPSSASKHLTAKEFISGLGKRRLFLPSRM